MAAAASWSLSVAPHGERTVWMYWECVDGMDMPPLVRRCIASAQRHAAVTLVDAATIHRFASPCHGVERVPHAAQRADYYRALLLHAHGGMWLDADTLVLGDLEPFFSALRESSASVAAAYESVRSKAHGSRVTACSVQYLVGRRGAPALRAWVEECERLIQSPGVGSLTWEALGNNAITTALNNTSALESGDLLKLPEHLVYGTGWRDHMRYYTWNEVAEAELRLAERARIVVLYGKFMYALPRERPGSLLARLFEMSGEVSEMARRLQQSR
ncbi:hypothetical protein AB1Y20_000494 [Prymnesium parvum]|uniref:Alpha-1,4-N-acetylglucosaminyltransferase n=1 Tax=Prymnesium parvum TaxID=97485 RepID=A0AB34K606_PRYPA